MRSRSLLFFVGGILSAIILCIAIVMLAKFVAVYSLTQYTKNLEDSQEKALMDAKQSIIYVQQFTMLYPDAIHSFSYFTGEYGSPRLNSEVGLYRRYILTMQIPVTLNEDRSSILDYGEPSIYLDEINTITEDEDRLLIDHGNIQLEFGVEKWETLIKNEGDISVLDARIQKDNPVPGFEKHWPYLR